jgi:hypothetical protein
MQSIKAIKDRIVDIFNYFHEFDDVSLASEALLNEFLESTLVGLSDSLGSLEEK